MGNHHVGRAMVRAADLVFGRRKEGETALQILDEICGPYKSCDAEFDDDLLGKDASALAKLATEAFGEGQTFADDVDGEGWYEGVYRPFRARFNFY